MEKRHQAEKLNCFFKLSFQNFKNSIQAPIEFSILSDHEISNISSTPQKGIYISKLDHFFQNFISTDQLYLKIYKKIIYSVRSQLEEYQQEEIVESIRCSLHLNTEDIFYFQGNLEAWETFEKNLKNRDFALILQPKIQLNLPKIELPLELNPFALIYFNSYFSICVFSKSSSFGIEHLPEFIFHRYLLTEYLNLKINDLILFYSDKKIENNQIQIKYSFNITPAKKPKVYSNDSNVPIYIATSGEKPLYVNSYFSNIISEKEYLSKIGVDSTTQKINQISQKSRDLESSIIPRLRSISEVCKILFSQIASLNDHSEWEKKLNWKNILSIDSIRKNYIYSNRFKLFLPIAIEKYKKSLELLSPTLSIPAFTLFPLSKILSLSQYGKTDWIGFLWWAYQNWKGSNFKLPIQNILSFEGKQLLQDKVIDIEWKVYYDFESIHTFLPILPQFKYREIWENILTQLSIKIFLRKKIVLNRNIIYRPHSSYRKFLATFWEYLTYPLIKNIDLLKDWIREKNWKKLVESYRQKVVYISYNKTFECTLLSKLSSLECPLILDLPISKYLNLGEISQIIIALTVDLSDWFKPEINLFPQLQGKHSLKKITLLSGFNSAQNYINLKWIKNGREAELLYLYYLFEEMKLHLPKNTINLSPKYWEKKERRNKNVEWMKIKKTLTEYCSIDVQNMVDAVKWLTYQYSDPNNLFNSRQKLTEFTRFLKKIEPEKLEQKIKTSYEALKNVGAQTILARPEPK